MKALAENGLPALEFIWLSFNKISPKGIENFVSKPCGNLTRLHLSGNHFGPDGVLELTKG